MRSRTTLGGHLPAGAALARLCEDLVRRIFRRHVDEVVGIGREARLEVTGSAGDHLGRAAFLHVVDPQIGCPATRADGPEGDVSAVARPVPGRLVGFVDEHLDLLARSVRVADVEVGVALLLRDIKNAPAVCGPYRVVERPRRSAGNARTQTANEIEHPQLAVPARARHDHRRSRLIR